MRLIDADALNVRINELHAESLDIFNGGSGGLNSYDIRKLVHDAPTEFEWISVGDRLPSYELVLVFCTSPLIRRLV